MWKKRGRLLVLVSLFSSLGAGCAVNPVTQRTELSLMTEAQEVRQGEEAYPLYTQMSQGLFQDAALQAYVARVGARVAARSQRPGLPYEFNVVNDSELNAYALPGGKISVTRGLLSRLENEAELAGVLAHEVGHVAARHAAAGYTRQVLVGVLASVGMAALQTADSRGADLLAKGGLVAASAVLMKYSRDQERQSDELGTDYMTAAGYNPEGFVQSMQALMAAHEKEPTGVETFFMSHPLTSERVTAATQRLSRYPPELRAPERLYSDEFRRATARLRSVEPAYAKMDAGRKLLSAGKPKEALPVLEEATRLGPDEALIWVSRAAAEIGAGRNEEGLASARKAASLYPGLFHAQFAAGVAAFELRRHAESLDSLAAAEKIVPGQPQVAFYRGRNFETQGRREEAARQYVRVLEGVKEGPMAEYAMGRLIQWGYVKPQQK
ncbi:MAG: M48 family metalloprotease [Deltaproteobacteria bacterium]|nr:M48 family metalloprotease [Deltaproteobacteria bacterium]